MHDDLQAGDDRRKIVPLFAFAAVVIGLAPWLHPSNTCNEWLMKWGQLSAHPMWLPIHQWTMAGFLVAGGAAFLFPLLGRRSTAAVAGGVTLGVGCLLDGATVLIHASAASSLGRAYMAAKSADVQQAVRAAAEAMVSYDESAHSVATALVSFGCCMIALALVQDGVLGKLTGLFMAGLGSIWAAHRYHVFNKLHFSIPETAHWDSLALWFAAIAFFLWYHNRSAQRASAADRPAAEPEKMRHALIETVTQPQ